MNTDWINVENAAELASPALLVWPERVQHNIDLMVELVGGDPSRLRPHVKTHKLGEVVRMQLDAGITKFKCATIAEAEMAAEAGAKDVLLAYQPVGPNIRRMMELGDLFPGCSFEAVTDDLDNLKQISGFFAEAGKTLRLFLDTDCGMGRSGIAPGDTAFEICRQIVELPGVELAGLHVYDGHIHDVDAGERESHFRDAREMVKPFVSRLREAGISVPLIVGGGSPTFPFHAKGVNDFEGIAYECSPGTTLFWDYGYGTKHADLDFEVATVLLTRIISKPGTGRLCIDLGHKAVAAENPIEIRVFFPAIPDAKAVIQSEEHLVVETAEAENFNVGDMVFGIPRHICPTVALHQEAVVIRDGRATGERWAIRSRDRRLSV